METPGAYREPTTASAGALCQRMAEPPGVRRILLVAPVDGGAILAAMSRYTEVIVLARDSEEVMEPLTQRDENRQWHGYFTRVDEGMFDGSRMPSEECYAWVVQFLRHKNWKGLMAHLESLPWPKPWSVQILVRDEDDDCFGMWMLYDGQLVEVPIPRTRREPFSTTNLGVLSRTDAPT